MDCSSNLMHYFPVPSLLDKSGTLLVQAGGLRPKGVSEDKAAWPRRDVSRTMLV